MTKAYNEIVDFIASGTTPRDVADFRASEATRQRVAELIEREKTSSLSSEERSELDHFLEAECLTSSGADD